MGARAVQGLLGERVALLVEAHVDAKRYLVADRSGLPSGPLPRQHRHPRGPGRTAVARRDPDGRATPRLGRCGRPASSRRRRQDGGRRRCRSRSLDRSAPRGGRSMTRPNVLLITLDQYRGDAVGCAGHPIVRTPNLDALAANGVRFANHFAQAAPCAPGRAALYTGTYQMNNRVVANGTPLDDRFDNVARTGATGRLPPDPVRLHRPGRRPATRHRPRRPTAVGLRGRAPRLRGRPATCRAPRAVAGLARRAGHDHLRDAEHALVTEPHRPAELVAVGVPHRPASSAGSTGRTSRGSPTRRTCARTRPTPRPGAGRARTTPPTADRRCRSGETFTASIGPAGASAVGRPDRPGEDGRCAAQYYGMCSEVDDQLGRVWEALRRAGQWDDTHRHRHRRPRRTARRPGPHREGGLLRVELPHPRHRPRPSAPGRPTAPWWTSSPRTSTCSPRLRTLIGVRVPAQCDGLPLTPFLDGEPPAAWRTAAHWEWDWRDTFIGDDGRRALGPPARAVQPRRRAHRHPRLRAVRQRRAGCASTWPPIPRGGPRSPTRRWSSRSHSRCSTWRSRHLDRNLTGFWLRDGGIGRRPFAPTPG